MRTRELSSYQVDLAQGKGLHDAVAGLSEDRPDLPLMSQSCKILINPELFDDILKREKVPVSILSGS